MFENISPHLKLMRDYENSSVINIGTGLTSKKKHRTGFGEKSKIPFNYMIFKCTSVMLSYATYEG